MHSDGGIAISTGAGRQRVTDFVEQRETEAEGCVDVVREVIANGNAAVYASSASAIAIAASASFRYLDVLEDLVESTPAACKRGLDEMARDNYFKTLWFYEALQKREVALQS